MKSLPTSWECDDTPLCDKFWQWRVERSMIFSINKTSCHIFNCNIVKSTVLSSFMICYWICNKSNMMGSNSEAETELPTLPNNQSSPLDLMEVRTAQSLVFCAVFHISLFSIPLLTIVLSVLLRFTASDYCFGIFRLFLLQD